MFETVVLATDGSESAQRSVRAGVDLASKFDAEVHALYVVDTGEIEDAPEEIRQDLETAVHDAGDEALSAASDAGGSTIVTAVRQGDPATEIVDYAEEVAADAIVMGTRGRHGDHSFLLGSVAEAVVRHAPQPVLTVRQLESEASA